MSNVNSLHGSHWSERVYDTEYPDGKHTNSIHSTPGDSDMADMKLETTARTAAHFGFAALLFALLGWMDLEILMLINHFSIRAQLLTCALGLCLSLSAYRRYQTWWLPMARSRPQTTLQGHPGARLIGHGIMLIAIGFALGYLMNAASVFTLMGAGLLSYLPWSRSKFCRDYFFLSHALLVAGALTLLVIAAGHQHPIMLIAHAWILWSLAAGLILLTLWLERSTALASTNSRVSPNRMKPVRDSELEVR